MNRKINSTLILGIVLILIIVIGLIVINIGRRTSLSSQASSQDLPDDINLTAPRNTVTIDPPEIMHMSDVPEIGDHMNMDMSH